jgi:uncharacterized protein (TIGR03435 family)
MKVEPSVHRRLASALATMAAALPLIICCVSTRALVQVQSAAASLPRFEVASVRLMQDRDKLPMAQQMYRMSPPGAAQFSVRNATLTDLIAFAYGIDSEFRLAGKPAWIDSTYYEIAAEPGDGATLSYEQLKPYVQQLLQDRFHLTYHRETKTRKGYVLVLANGGPKLVSAKGEAEHAYLWPDHYDAVNVNVGALASMLGEVVGAPVVDKTGLKGNYNFRFSFAQLDTADSARPSIFTAIEEQLGLKLENQSVPVDVFVIDHVDQQPTEN